MLKLLVETDWWMTEWSAGRLDLLDGWPSTLWPVDWLFLCRLPGYPVARLPVYPSLSVHLAVHWLTDCTTDWLAEWVAEWMNDSCCPLIYYGCLFRVGHGPGSVQFPSSSSAPWSSSIYSFQDDRTAPGRKVREWLPGHNDWMSGWQANMNHTQPTKLFYNTDRYIPTYTDPMCNLLFDLNVISSRISKFC